MARTGRPKADNPKSIQIMLRMDKETTDKLDELVAFYGDGETRVSVLRKGIDRLYADMKKE